MATQDEIMQRIDQIHAARQEAIRPLAAVIAERQRLLTALADLTEPYRQSYTTALTAGWTEGELLLIGAEKPTKHPRNKNTRGRNTGRTTGRRHPHTPPADTNTPSQPATPAASTEPTGTTRPASPAASTQNSTPQTTADTA
ncbi:hypothetical protein ACFP1Z_28595 [Streptomyces gamaensis]|uniref:Uncharacterized protein n=1 Tax=Streptomyces gamaensis TaxID=1763542 RepID=A0ABW0ZAJ6_9ACTN